MLANLARKIGGKLAGAPAAASSLGVNLKGKIMAKALITGATLAGVIVVMMWPELHVAFCEAKI